MHYFRWDLTEVKAYSLSDQTLKVLKSLPEKIEIIGFFQEGGNNKEKFNKLFESYKYHSKLLKLKLQ